MPKPEQISMNEPLIVKGMGTKIGYLKPPRAFRLMVKDDLRDVTMPEPEARAEIVTRDGIRYVRLIYEWKEEDICQPKNK